MSDKMYKAGQKVSSAYKKFDDLLEKGLFSAMKEKFGKKKLSTSKALTVFDPKKALPSKLPKAASKLSKLSKLGKVAKFARATTPIGLASLALTSIKKYPKGKSPQEMARKAYIKGGQDPKKAMTSQDLAKDLLNFNTGGTMLKGGQKKLDKNKDGKISGEDFKLMKKNMGGEMKSSKGYGAARTKGMGLQDEQLVPGKSMDYYKDLM